MDVLTVFLAIIGTVALIGNTFVVILLLKKRDWLKKVHSCLLLALGVQDILTAIGILLLPGFVRTSDAYKVPESATRGQLFCSVIWSRYIPFALAITSVYTCLMLAFDRWFAVFRPVSYRRFSTSVKVVAMMVILPWLAGFGFEVNTILNVRHVVQEDGSHVCRWNKIDTSAKSGAIAIFTFIGMIALPAILMILIYAKIIIRRREQAVRINPQLLPFRSRNNSIMPNDTEIRFTTRQNVTQSSSGSLKRLTIIACASSAIVTVCWLPDQFYFCLFQLGLVDLRNELHNGLIILAFLNTCLNPVLYCFSNKQYADEFETFLCCVYHKVRTLSVSQRVQSQSRTI